MKNNVKKTAPDPIGGTIGGQSQAEVATASITHHITEHKTHDSSYPCPPGVMLYFDILPALSQLTDAQNGKLLISILEYAAYGVLPSLDSIELRVTWELIRPKIEHDFEKYRLKIERNRRAANKRWEQRQKTTVEEMDADASLAVLADSTTASFPTTPTDPSTSTAAAESSMTAVLGGVLGKGVLLLSEDQIEDLINRMGIETFDRYAEQLSAYILNKRAHVKNHYQTILKWWDEDSALKH